MSLTCQQLGNQKVVVGIHASHIFACFVRGTLGCLRAGIKGTLSQRSRQKVSQPAPDPWRLKPMDVRWKTVLARITVWLAAEILLSFLGIDDIAGYSEFIFERYCIQSLNL